MKIARTSEAGGIDAKVIFIVVLSILFLAAGSAAIWAYMNYIDAKENVDSKVEAAKAEAVRIQQEKDLSDFIAREKEPLRTFAGPDDYGHLTFDYPKTWSVYQALEPSKSGATFAAYLSPLVVPPVPNNALNDLVASTKATPSMSAVSKFAVRLKIESKLYEDSLKNYESLLKTGQIKSSAFTNDEITGTLYEGRFNNDISGVALVIKMRDRTLTLRTDADVFKEDFTKLIQTIKFNE